jgi:hypothetical protein
VANYDASLGAGTLRLNVDQASQSQAGNSSSDSWSLWLYCSNNQSFNNNNNVRWDVNINGSGYGGNFGFDFRNGNTSKLIASGSTGIAHNADGTKLISVSGSIGATGTSAISSGGTSGTFTQTRIPKPTTVPQSFTATATGRDVALTWAAPSDTNGAAVASYSLSYSTDGGSSWTSAVSTTALSYTFASLPGGLTYQFRVLANNSAGASPYATVSAFVSSGGRRWNGSAFSPTTIAKRWTGSANVDLTIAKKWLGSAWGDLS